MATVIDQLFVTLGFDPKEFKKGTKEASAAGEKMANDIDDQVKRAKKAETDLGKSRKAQADQQRKEQKEKQARWKEQGEADKKALDSVGKLKTEVIGLGAALLGAAGAKEFISNVIGGNAALYRQSQLLGNSMRSLEKWGMVADKWGGSREGVIGAISGAQQAVARERTYGGSQAQGALAQLGLSGDDVNDADLMIRKLRQSLKGLSPQEKEVRLAQAGLSGLSSIIQLSETDFAEYVRQADAAAAATEAGGRKAQQAEAAWKGVKDAFSGVADTLLVMFTPQVEDATKSLSNMSTWVSSHKGEIGEFFQGLATAAKAVGEGMHQLYEIMNDIGRLIDRLDQKLTGGVLGKFIQQQKSGLSSSVTWWKDHILAAGGDKEAQARLAGGAGSRTSGGAITGQAAAAGVGATSDPVAFFMSKGYTREQAAGIVANLKAESGLKVGAVGDGGQAYGLAQWHPDRQAKFKEVFGRDIKGSSLEQQMEFVAWELKNSEAGAGNRLRSAKTAKEAGALVAQLYERPADTSGEMSKRGSSAEQILAQSLQGPGGGGKNVNIDTTIGQVVIHTQATDAAGMARDAQSALQKQPLLNYATSAAAG
jgi:hypothetical protein